jgi:hypothetical protein
MITFSNIAHNLIIHRNNKHVIHMCQDSSEYTNNRLETGVRFPAGTGFLFSAASRLVLGSTQPPMLWMLGALSLGVKQLGCEADYSPTSSAKFKNVWNYTSIPPWIFMVWYFA